MNFNPRSPWGERHRETTPTEALQAISIHAPRGGSDYGPLCQQHFILSISIHAPRGGSDGYMPTMVKRPSISIHAPRGGSDGDTTTTTPTPDYFNPRSPWGERPAPPGHNGHGRYFNPRSPWGERHYMGSTQFKRFAISIHAPRGGSDSEISLSACWATSFQSTLPVGGATPRSIAAIAAKRISIHAPRGGSDISLAG